MILNDSIQRTEMQTKIVSREIIQEFFFRIFTGQQIIILLLFIILGGCKQRKVTTATPQMDIEPQYRIRVLLFNDINNCSLKITSPFSITCNDPNLQAPSQPAQFDQFKSPISIQLIDGEITIAGTTFTHDQIIVSPDDPYVFNLNGSDYRGKLKLIINPDGSSFDAINLVPLESYLAGVAGAEMPDYWEPEALQAQVIAARTYCLYTKRRFGSNRHWDMKKTAAHQVYLGLNSESSAIWNAVNETSGMVLTCKQADGTEDIFPTYYSSTCGGHTENSENVFSDSFEPLIGVPCPYCKDVSKLKFFFWPMVQFDKTYVKDKLLQRYETLQNLVEITDITIAKQSDYSDFSRVTMVKLLGSSGKTDFLRAEDFRLAIDSTGRKIKSASFQFVDLDENWAFLSGRGWGHGVGMCQYGAEGMARQGKTAEQILYYYYPHSKILKIDYN